MTIDQPHIDPYLFEKHFSAFKGFVEDKSGVAFTSFASNPYTETQEGYKYEIYRSGRDLLKFHEWRQSDIGKGDILACTVRSIELQINNLVPWQGRFGETSRPHHRLRQAQGDSSKTQLVEACIFELYRGRNDEGSFHQLTNIVGNKYPLLAYLFFLKDRSKYLPIAPTTFDTSFTHLGADFTTSRQCSWHNYTQYLQLIGEVRQMLADTLHTEVTLLDAHSFTWVLSRQMEKEHRLADVQEYLNLSATERDAIIKARIGQGRFRQSLIDYWSRCAVTGCTETPLLRASHIKPWAESSLNERLCLYNGLLLSPTIDACFDSGFVSFDDGGAILISSRLTVANAQALSIHAGMKMQKIAPEHKPYLAYHRENIFK